MGSEPRTEQQCEDLARIAAVQQLTSRVPDYWAGVEDGLRYALGELPDPIQARLLAEGLD
jgi:hypothetical protein